MITNVHIWSHATLFLLEWEMLQTKFIEKIKIHFVIINIFFYENRAIYSIIWKNIVERNRPQITIWRMRNVCWIPGATDTHSEYLTLIAFPPQQWLRESVPVLYLHCLSCLTFILLTWKIW